MMEDYHLQLPSRTTKSKVDSTINYALDISKLKNLKITTQKPNIFIFTKKPSSVSKYSHHQQIKITNTVGNTISFKIRSTNPYRYIVVPFQGDINNTRQVIINIWMIAGEQDINNFLQDQFDISWGFKLQDNKKNNYLHHERYGIQFADINQNSQHITHDNHQSKEKGLYENMLKNNLVQIKAIEKEIQINEKTKPIDSFLSKSIIVTIGLIGFVLGLLAA